MRRPRNGILAWPLWGLFWVLACSSASGAASVALPRLEGPAGYIGELTLERESYRARLYLGPAGNFVLREELLLPNGKRSGWEHSGLWHQVRDNAFVQLSNASGLYRLLNVGGGGNLYLNMRFSNGGQHSAVLRQDTAAPVEFDFSGLLRPSGKEPLLEDSCSGLSYRAAPGEVLAAFLADNPLADGSVLPLRARVVEVPGSGCPPALQARAIRSIPPEKKRASRDPAGVFLENVAGKHWKITRLGREAPSFVCVLRFTPGQDRHEGRVECFDGQNRLVGGYRLWKRELALSFADAAELPVALAELFSRTRAWRLAGKVLELLDAKEPLALLEAAR